MMPWEGNGVSPLDPGVVETTRPNGLSKVSLRKDFEALEVRMFRRVGGQPGHYVQPAPEPPKEFLGQLREELKERWENWKITM